ncbi:MAG: GlsB/YeaQ/YmgE family stress response membrane protein [Gaiellaceae bacterium]
MEVVVILIVVILALLLAGTLIGLAFELVWLAVTGLIIGALGRLVLPGRQEIGLLPTALIGIAASLLGGILANVFDAGWLVRFLVAVALAAIGISLFASSSHGRGRLDRA